MKAQFIDQLSAILGDSIEKPKMHFSAQHNCLIDNLLSPTTIQYDFFKGGNTLNGELFHKGYIAIDCKPQVDAAINSLSEQRDLLFEMYKNIVAYDDSVRQPDKVLSSTELKQLMQVSRKQQDEAGLGFYDEYKLDCYTKASSFADKGSVNLAMHRCDAIYQDISTKYDSDISAIRQEAGFETHWEL